MYIYVKKKKRKRGIRREREGEKFRLKVPRESTLYFGNTLEIHIEGGGGRCWDVKCLFRSII